MPVTKSITKHLTFASILALMGCSAAVIPSFDDLVADSDAIASHFDAQGWDVEDSDTITRVADIPASGHPTYSGVFAFEIYDDASLVGGAIGAIDLMVDLDGNSMSGTANNFRDPDNGIVTGNLNITSGDLNRSADPDTEWQLTADIDGTLTDDEATVFVLDGTLGADFYGATGEGIYGESSGDLDVGLDDFQFYGFLAGLKD